MSLTALDDRSCAQSVISGPAALEANDRDVVGLRSADGVLADGRQDGLAGRRDSLRVPRPGPRFKRSTPNGWRSRSIDSVTPSV